MAERDDFLISILVYSYMIFCLSFVGMNRCDYEFKRQHSYLLISVCTSPCAKHVTYMCNLIHIITL